LKIRFYGRLGDRLGSEIEVAVPPGTDTVVELREVLAEMFPQASGELRQRSRACVADGFVADDYRLASVDSIEFLPPLSGG
jgi:sulfur-carrier protein